ncbi:MAG: aminoacetone oxidase family FAD-binding enzyme [Oscillospiraceae bacterium]|nr:aminoacetone oxidase family FAD-binding enzyme [Oscillospiraceae bacterium]
MPEILIIGGGASGMTAALTAARKKDNRVTLLERQARVGRKLLSTGNGRCNLTNTGAAPERYHGGGAAFTAPALAAFGPERALEFFRSLGLMTIEEYGGRVFPLSNQAASVVDVLRFALEKDNITVAAGERAERVKRVGGGFEVKTDQGARRADKLIVACGGCAGAKLGGVTDGYEILRSLGHRIITPRTAMGPLVTDPTYPRALKGIRADAAVRLLVGGAVRAEGEGDLLFADYGVSGTAVFDLARYVPQSGGELSVDFFRSCTLAEVTDYLAARRAARPTAPANALFIGALQTRLGQMLCRSAGISGSRTAGELSPAELEHLAGRAKDFRLAVISAAGFDAAQVTAGGADTAQFDPKTLQSRLVPSLYACGEVLDIDGDCGGYNLQWAWASGTLAGRLRT